MLQGEDGEDRNFDVMVCLLRMVSGVVALGKLKGYKMEGWKDVDF